VSKWSKGLKRSRPGTRRLNLADLREVLKDGRQWVALGIVTDIDGNGAVQFDTNDDGSLRDILVDVVTQPGQEELICRLAGLSSTGVVTCPNEGDEVAVLVPEGQTDFQPTIIAVLSSQAIPNPSGQGPAVNRTVIVSGEVFIHDGAGGAQRLATLAELQGHIHPTPVGPTDVALPSTQQGDPIIGTQTLQAK
jgi:hypothetical protein